MVRPANRHGQKRQRTSRGWGRRTNGPCAGDATSWTRWTNSSRRAIRPQSKCPTCDEMNFMDWQSASRWSARRTGRADRGGVTRGPECGAQARGDARGECEKQVVPSEIDQMLNAPVAKQKDTQEPAPAEVQEQQARQAREAEGQREGQRQGEEEEEGEGESRCRFQACLRTLLVDGLANHGLRVLLGC